MSLGGRVLTKLSVVNENRDGLYRLYRDGGNMVSDYTLRNKNEIIEHGPTKLKNEYSIPNTPNAVAKVEIPAGVKMRMSTVAKNDWGDGGGTQHIIQRDNLPQNWFEHSDELTDELKGD